MYITLFCVLIPLNNNKIPFKGLLVNEHCLEVGIFQGLGMVKIPCCKVYSL